ncbi:hypothetical protein [Pseudomonas sp.]|uniref:hypothetical protein n=1 Tax=Pseudomonas sp. TaxID=306 RepID=UPI00286A1750|nr:hypothetical protein [Pseudomonas sp.]
MNSGETRASNVVDHARRKDKARKGIIFYGIAINYFHVAGGHDTRDKQLTQHQFPVSANALAKHMK